MSEKAHSIRLSDDSTLANQVEATNQDSNKFPLIHRCNFTSVTAEVENRNSHDVREQISEQ